MDPSTDGMLYQRRPRLLTCGKDQICIYLPPSHGDVSLRKQEPFTGSYIKSWRQSLLYTYRQVIGFGQNLKILIQNFYSLR